MEFRPHKYQEYAREFIIGHPVCALILDMGLGKTVITLTALWELALDYFEVGKVLVIAPFRVARDTWKEELEKWDHLKGLSVSVVVGSEKERLDALEKKASVYVINRENVVWLCEKHHWDFDMIVIDELSSFKSYQAKRFKALRRYRPKAIRVVGLTGTPGNLMDLWAEIGILDMGQRLGRYIGAYRDRFFLPDKRNRNIIYSYKPRDGAEEAIYNLISDICISMKAEDYLSMPECLYHRVEVRMDEKEEKLYRQMEKDMLLPFEDGDVDAVNAAALSGKLLQMANGAVYDENHKVRHIHDKKLDASLDAEGLEPEEPFRMKDIVYIITNKGFWLIALLCVLFYSAVFPFIKYAADLMVQKYNVDPKLAGTIPGLLPIGAIILTPLFGSLYDRIGKGATLMVIGSVMLIFVHTMFALPILNIWWFATVIMIILGFAFSLVPSAMWPSVPKIIPEKQLGTAYALIFWVQNWGLMGVPLLIGWVLNSYCKGPVVDGAQTYDYTLPMAIFAMFGVLALIVALMLKVENKKKGYGLEEANIQK